MVTRLMTLAALASILVAPAAFADPKYRNDPQSNGGYDYARVLNVEPIIRQVRVETPRRECWMETRYDQPAPPRQGLAGPMILGALIGGSLGHQFEGHRNATLAGAVIGAAIGHDVGARRQSRYAYAQPRAYEVERCDSRIEQSYEERIDGYDVEYEYCGRRYHTRLPYDPGDRMRIRVAVSPVSNGHHYDDDRYDRDDD